MGVCIIIIMPSALRLKKWSKNFHERLHYPALVTPVVGESILKLCFRSDVLPLQTSLQPRAAVGICCLHSPMHFNGGVINPQMASSTPGSSLLTQFPQQPQFTIKTASRSVHPFLSNRHTHKDRPRYICGNKQHLCTLCM